MADESSGSDDTTGDGLSESSTTNPDAGPTADSSEEWGATGRSDRTSADDRRERDDADGGWDRIPLDLSDSSDADDSDAETDAGDEYTPEDSSTPIEPGDPDLENALFVLLGAIAMVLVFARLVMVMIPAG